jgi:hypothetical protein
MSDPNKVDPTNSQKLLKATSNASRCLCCGVRSAVRLRKSGAAPSGFTTGNSPAKTRRKAFEISFTIGSLSLGAQAGSRVRGKREKLFPTAPVHKSSFIAAMPRALEVKLRAIGELVV